MKDYKYTDNLNTHRARIINTVYERDFGKRCPWHSSSIMNIHPCDMDVICEYAWQMICKKGGKVREFYTLCYYIYPIYENEIFAAARRHFAKREEQGRTDKGDQFGWVEFSEYYCIK